MSSSLLADSRELLTLQHVDDPAPADGRLQHDQSLRCLPRPRRRRAPRALGMPAHRVEHPPGVRCAARRPAACPRWRRRAGRGRAARRRRARARGRAMAASSSTMPTPDCCAISFSAVATPPARRVAQAVDRRPRWRACRSTSSCSGAVVARDGRLQLEVGPRGHDRHAVLGDGPAQDHDVAGPGADRRRSSWACATTPTPRGRDEAPVGLAAVDHLGVAR